MISNLVTKKYFIVVGLLLFVNICAFAQITTNDTPPPPPKEKVQKPKSNFDTEFFLSYAPQFSFRTLEENASPFGDPLGDRESEYGIWTNSFSLGLRSRLHKNLFLDFGLGYFTNGEANEYSYSDSTISTERIYKHFGVPVKLAYITGGDLSFYASLGLTPKAFINTQFTETLKSNSNNTEEVVKEKQGYNAFLIDATATLGLRLRMNDSFGISIMGEARRQLTSNFSDQGSYIRKAYSIGFNLGLQFYIN